MGHILRHFGHRGDVDLCDPAISNPVQWLRYRAQVGARACQTIKHISLRLLLSPRARRISGGFWRNTRPTAASSPRTGRKSALSSDFCLRSSIFITVSALRCRSLRLKHTLRLREGPEPQYSDRNCRSSMSAEYGVRHFWRSRAGWRRLISDLRPSKRHSFHILSSQRPVSSLERS